MIKATQEQFFMSANAHAAVRNAVMLDLLFGSNPISDDELRALIAKRPEVYGRFANYLGTR